MISGRKGDISVDPPRFLYLTFESEYKFRYESMSSFEG